MKESWLKDILRSVFFRPAAVRRIRWGPLRGMVFRVGPVTGLAPWYSGAERAHQQFFRRVVRPGMVAVDVGANWGLHTLLLSRLVGPTGRVVALEPYRPAFAELRWHIRANHLENVIPIEAAVGDRDGECDFVPGDSASTGRVADAVKASGPSAGEPIEGALRVEICRLDSLASRLDLERLDLVKVDVEGAESRVLCGAEQVTARFRPIFVIDLHTPEQDLFVARWLTERGYHLERLSGPPIVRSDLGWPHREGVWGSIVARPIESGGNGR
jgi:FkbM family methyltransferase